MAGRRLRAAAGLGWRASRSPSTRSAIKPLRASIFTQVQGRGWRSDPLVFDLFPKTTTEEQTGGYVLGVEPKVKIANVLDGSGFKAEVSSDVRQAHVVTRASGVQ